MVTGGYSHLLQILAHLVQVLQSNFVYAARFEFGFSSFACCMQLQVEVKVLEEELPSA